MSWDERHVEEFLQEYRQHECLWNPFHRQFHDCFAKGEALKKLCKNLRLGFGVQDCLRLLKCIREKYVEDQTKTLLTLRSNLCQPKWMQIVESMLEKIVGDEDCKSNYLSPLHCKPPEPPVKILFRHTITSKKRKCPTTNNPRQIKSHKRRRRKNKCQRTSKLERRGRCCNDDAERDMDRCRAAQDCSRPQSNWCKQRDDYLDKLTWQKPCNNKPVECPGLASHLDRMCRIENVGKDPCADTTPVYLCPNRDTHVNCDFNRGRRRATDIYPTESRNCRSPPRPTCPPVRKPSPERCPKKEPKKVCCPCPPPTPEDKCSKKESKKVCCPCPPPTPEDKCPKKPTTTEVCTRDTCPSYKKSESKVCQIIKPTECGGVKFDASCSPRVAARFENGVLEAYSQFKVVFPSGEQQTQQKKKCCTQKVQTDRTTRECAVGVSSRELLRRRNSGSSRCTPRKKNTGCGTNEDFVECCPCPNNDPPENNPCHEYVLLTPGGKYVPLVKTKSQINNCKDEEDEGCQCGMESQKQDVCDNNRSRRECSPVRNCEKQEEDKCPSTTTKLLLRCLEHMLNLEEQQQCSTAKTNDDNVCEPCRRKEQQRRELAANASSSCIPCQEERPNNNSPRGKLTQNFLEILKCAMELDCKQDDCQEDVGCCRCEDIASSTLKDECEKKDNDVGCGRKASDKVVQRKISMRETAVGGGNCVEAESKGTQDRVNCVTKGVQCGTRKNRDKHPKKDTVLDNLVRCANWPDYKTARKLCVDLKCDEVPNVTKVPATTLPPPQRDQTLACLREELQRDNEYFERGRVGYVKCNQVYRSYAVRSPEDSPTRLRGNGCYSYR